MFIKAAIADLESKVGTETSVSSWLTVTQDMINQFADVTRDWQWIHIDPERAKKQSPFGTTVAHGFLTLSLIPYLAGPTGRSYEGVKMSVNYGLNKVRFPHPVAVGSNIRARTELQSFKEVKGGLQIIRKVTIEIEGVAKPACVAEMVGRIYF